jgi:hypothetical protein
LKANYEKNKLSSRKSNGFLNSPIFFKVLFSKKNEVLRNLDLKKDLAFNLIDADLDLRRNYFLFGKVRAANKQQVFSRKYE